MAKAKLSHVDEGGRAQMVDVSAKPVSLREAIAEGFISLEPATLRAIAEGVPQESRGTFRSIASESARTIFSDSLPIDLGERLGFRLHWHLYTVPGQPRSSGARAAVLQGVDGIVFVADSAPLRMAENMASMAELKAMLAGQAKSLESFPVVLECNKVDLPGATPAFDLATSLELPASTAVRASAINGEGVFEALRAISQQVAANL